MKKIISAGIGIIGIIFLFVMGTENKTTDEAIENELQKYYRIYAIPLPNQLTFAGEKVPLERTDIKEKLDKELLINVYWQSATLLKIKRAHKYFPVIEAILKKYGIPDDFKYLAVAESNLENVTSPAGAKGIWQLMKPTAQKYGLTVNDEIDERYNLEKATEAACQYFLEAKEKFGSWTLVAASYNRGMGGLQKAMEDQKTYDYYDLYLNPETARYIYRTLALKLILENPQKYGFRFRLDDLYQFPPFDTVKVAGSVESWPQWAIQQGITYGQLRYMNPWIKSYRLTNKEQDTLIVKIPFLATKLKITEKNFNY